MGEGGQTLPGIWQISKPNSNQGADYAPHSTASPPGFKKLSTPLNAVCMQAVLPCTKFSVADYGCKIVSLNFLQSMLRIKFRFSEKATKIWRNLPLCFHLNK